MYVCMYVSIYLSISVHPYLSIYLWAKTSLEPSQLGLKNTLTTSQQRSKTLLMSILDMILSSIWWRSFSPGAFGNMGYPFIVITPRPTLTRSSSNCWGPIYGSNRTCVWWGFIPGALGNVEYAFIGITPRSALTWCGSTC